MADSVSPISAYSPVQEVGQHAQREEQKPARKAKKRGDTVQLSAAARAAAAAQNAGHSTE